jgi:hypothetical protein
VVHPPNPKIGVLTGGEQSGGGDCGHFLTVFRPLTSIGASDRTRGFCSQPVGSIGAPVSGIDRLMIGGVIGAPAAELFRNRGGVERRCGGAAVVA